MKPTGKAGKPRNKPPDLKGATQFDRFVETAKALEVDESGHDFLRALDLVAPAKKAARPSSPKGPPINK